MILWNWTLFKDPLGFFLFTHAPKFILQFAHLFLVANVPKTLALSSPVSAILYPTMPCAWPDFTFPLNEQINCYFFFFFTFSLLDSCSDCHKFYKAIIKTKQSFLFPRKNGKIKYEKCNTAELNMQHDYHVCGFTYYENELNH